MEKKKVLIIDDEKEFTDLVREFLEGTGRFRVRAENAPNNGVFAVKTFKPDLILLDVVMPGMDGTDVADQIRREKVGKKIPIVFVSALFNHRQEQMVGSEILLSKPIHLNELITCVEKNLSS